MIHRRILLRVVAMLALVPVSGCVATMTTVQLYPGEPRPKEEVAIIEPAEAVSIAFIDRKRVGSNRSAEVLPGEHTVMIELSTRYFYGSGWGGQIHQRDVTFVAQPGHVYRADAEGDGAGWAWVVDTEIGDVVGGRKPE